METPDLRPVSPSTPPSGDILSEAIHQANLEARAPRDAPSTARDLFSPEETPYDGSTIDGRSTPCVDEGEQYSPTQGPPFVTQYTPTRPSIPHQAPQSTSSKTVTSSSTGSGSSGVVYHPTPIRQNGSADGPQRPVKRKAPMPHRPAKRRLIPVDNGKTGGTYDNYVFVNPSAADPRMVPADQRGPRPRRRRDKEPPLAIPLYADDPQHPFDTEDEEVQQFMAPQVHELSTSPTTTLISEPTGYESVSIYMFIALIVHG